jgi:hypothetical protein
LISPFRLFFSVFILIFCKLSFSEGLYISYSLDKPNITKIFESKEKLNRNYQFSYSGLGAGLRYDTKSDPGKAQTVTLGYDFGNYLLQGFYSKGHILGKTSFLATVSYGKYYYDYENNIYHDVNYSLHGVSVVGKIPITKYLNLEPELGIVRACVDLKSNLYIKKYTLQLYHKNDCGELPKFGIGLSYNFSKDLKFIVSSSYLGHPTNSVKRASTTSLSLRTYF